MSIRFDYASIKPWLRTLDDGHFAAVGGSEGLVVWSDLPLEIVRTQETATWWREWCRGRDHHDPTRTEILRSALVLKSLVHAPTGAIAAAATTSPPEEIGGTRNWDYRYSWVRHSWLTVRALADVGFTREADGFRRFIERSAAGSADELQLLYRIDGGPRVHELTSMSSRGTAARHR